MSQSHAETWKSIWDLQFSQRLWLKNWLLLLFPSLPLLVSELELIFLGLPLYFLKVKPIIQRYEEEKHKNDEQKILNLKD